MDEDELHAVTSRDNPNTDFDEGGRYWISRVPAGDCLVREGVPDGFVQTFPTIGFPIDLGGDPRDPNRNEPSRQDSHDENPNRDLFRVVPPELIDLHLAVGEVVVEEVSLTINPFCVRPFPTDESIQRLKDGNARYVRGESMHPHTEAATRRSLIDGQKPFVAILGCADFRSVPELAFHTSIGELFVVRVAGNVASPENNGGLEYAVEQLGVQLIVVLGYQRCGAVTAAWQGYDGPGHIHSIVDAIQPAIEEAKDLDGDPLENAIHCNIKRVVHLLEQQDPILSKAMQDNQIRVIPACYQLDTGAVDFFES